MHSDEHENSDDQQFDEFIIENLCLGIFQIVSSNHKLESLTNIIIQYVSGKNQFSFDDSIDYRIKSFHKDDDRLVILQQHCQTQSIRRGFSTRININFQIIIRKKKMRIFQQYSAYCLISKFHSTTIFFQYNSQ